jgi:hypothetical protein
MQTGFQHISSDAIREGKKIQAALSGPSQSGATRQLTGMAEQGPRVSGGGIGRGGGGGGGVKSGLDPVEDALKKLAANARFNAELAKRIGENEKGVLDEHVKLKMAIAEQRRAFTRQFDIRTTEGARRTRELAQTAVAERQQKLAQRAFEAQETLGGTPSKTIATAVTRGGIQREAATKVLQSQVQREIAIAQTELDLAEKSAASIARRKVLLDQLNREIAKEVRLQQDVAGIAAEHAAVRRQQVQQDRANLKAVKPSDRIQQAILERETRESNARQVLQNQAKMRTKAGEDVLKAEGEVAAGAKLEAARRRQQYLRQFDVKTEGGRKATGELAALAVGEREQQMAQRNMEIQQTLASGGAARIAQSKALEAALAREVSIEQTKKDLASGAASSMAREKVQRDELNRQIAAQVRAQQDLGAIAKENVAKERDRLAQRSATRRAETPEDRSAIARDKVAEAARARDIAARARAQEDVGAIARENVAVQRQRIAQERANLAAATPADVTNQARFAVEKRLASVQGKLAEQAELRSAAGQRLGMQEQALATQTAELKATRAQLRAADQKLVAAEATEARAREEQAARVAIQRYGGDAGALQGAELTARAAVLQRAHADRERAAIARQTGAEEREAAAQRKLEEAKLRAAIRVRERELIKESVASGAVGGGTTFQRLQFAMRPSQTKLPEEYLGLKQFMGEKAMTTFGFAASGMMLGGAIAAISEMFKDATRLEQTFVRLRGQMEGLGKIEAFGEVREQIHQIAAETGQAGDKVGSLVSRLIGISGDPLKAVTEARSAAQLSTVTGLDPKELEKSLVPIAKAFKLTVDEIGDGIVDLAERTGANEQEITSFFGKTAAAAHNAGLTFEEVQIIGGTMANALGGAFGSAGESINKVFTTVVSNADKIIAVLDQAPDTRKFIEPFAEQIGEGDPGQAYLTLVRAYREFSDTQKDTMVQNVVSRREAEDFYAVFDNANDVIKQVDNQQQRATESQGKMQRRWTEFKDTVGVTMQRIATSFESLGDALFRSGLAEFLTTLGQALQLVVGAVGLAVNAFASFNEITGGVPMTLLKIIGVAALLTKAYNLTGAAIGKTAAITRVEATTETATTATKVEGAAASNVLAVSEQRLAVAKAGTVSASTAQRQAFQSLLGARPVAGAAAAAAAPGAMPLQYGVTGAGGRVAGTFGRVAPSVPAGVVGAVLPAALPIGPRRLIEETRATRVAAGEAERAAAAAAARRAMQQQVGAGLVARFQSRVVPDPLRMPTGKILPLKEYELVQQRGIAVQESYARATASSAEATVGTAAAASTLGASQAAAARVQQGATQAAGRLSRAQAEAASRLAADARGSGRLTRARQALERGYDTRRADVTGRLPALAEGAIPPRPGMFARAFAGGSLLRSARADVGMERAGMPRGRGFASGIKAAPVASAMIAVAGAAIVKQAYDTEVQEVQEAADAARQRLRTMNVQQLRTEASTAQGDWATRIQGWLFRQATPEAMVKSELAVAEASDTGALARLGGKGRPPPVTQTASKETQKIFTTRQAQIGKEIGQRMGAADKARIGEMMKAGEDSEFLKKGFEFGLLETSGFLGLSTSVKEGKDIPPEAIEKARAWATQIDGLSDAEKEKRAKFAKELDKLIAGQPDLSALANEAAKIGESEGIASAMEASGQSTEDFMRTWKGGQDEQFKDLQILQQEFQSGRITQAKYIDDAKKRINTMESAGKKMANTPKGQEMLAVAGQMRRDLALLEEASLTWLDDLSTNMAVLGSTRPKGTKATMHAASLAKQSMDTQIKALPTLMQEEVEAWQESAAKVFDPQARIAALNAGPKYSATTARGFFAKQVKESTKATEAIQRLADATGLSPDAVRDQIAERAQATGKSLVDAGNEWITEQYQGALSQGDLSKATRISIARRGFGESLADIQNLPDQQLTEAQRAAREIDIMAGARKAKGRVAQAEAGQSAIKQAAIASREAAAAYDDVKKKAAIGEATQEDLDNAFADMITAQQAGANAQFQFAQLRLQRDVILADRDPVKENAAQMRIAEAALAHARATGDESAIEQAEQQILQLQQAAAENQLNIIRGAMTIAAARDAEDPMKGAVLALQAAEFELAHAHGEADREQKEAAVISARQRLNATVSSALSADAQLAITLANLRGDTVGAATVAAQNAKRLLDEAIAKGITDRNVLAPLEGALAEANKQLYLGPIQKQISDLDYLYGMEQMSLGDYIAMLQAQLSRLVYDSQEYRDLNLKIHNLKKSAQADFGWSLPGNLELPTLYETRRASETIFKMGGGPYQDNRNVNVNIAVNGAQDPVAVATQVQTALNNSLRGGQTYTAGLPVAAGI